MITPGPFACVDPIVRVIDDPFLFNDHARADAILDGPVGAEIPASLESSSFKGLCFSENGCCHLTNSKPPVSVPEDVGGLKIRAVASALHRSIWQARDANPPPSLWLPRLIVG